MASEHENACLGTEVLDGFLRRFGCRLVDADGIGRAIRAYFDERGEGVPWLDRWLAEEGAQYSNDMATLVFEVPLESLSGSRCLDFTQQVWMLQPHLFEHQDWGGRGFVRMWWNPASSVFPYFESDQEDQDCRVIDQPQYVAWSERRRREGVPEPLMDRLDATIIWMKPREAEAMTEADFERWLEGARQESESKRGHP